MAYRIVVVGTSLGGLSALKQVFNRLPLAFGLPVVVVQHQGSGTGELAALLQRYCLLPVREPDDKEPVAPGRVYLAPAGYHLLVEAGRFALSTEGPVHYARPSIDVLFESAAESYGTGVVGVALTSASQDGVHGLGRIKAAGGLVIVQEPATAESRVLPAAAIAQVKVDRVLRLEQIAPFLALLAQPGPARDGSPARAGGSRLPRRPAPAHRRPVRRHRHNRHYTGSANLAATQQNQRGQVLAPAALIG
jgi:two-component system chemotaxis response regulator CheB